MARAQALVGRAGGGDGRVLPRHAQWLPLAESSPALIAAVATASVYPGWDYPAPRGIFCSDISQWLAFVDGRTSKARLFGDEAYRRGKFLQTCRVEIRFAGPAAISGTPSRLSCAGWRIRPGVKLQSMPLATGEFRSTSA